MYTFRGSSMVEQLPVKELVPGSSPGRGARKEERPSGRFFVLCGSEAPACLVSGRERLFLIESARWKSTRDGSRESWPRSLSKQNPLRGIFAFKLRRRTVLGTVWPGLERRSGPQPSTAGSEAGS